MKKPSVIFIVGPTATGKSELAVELGKHLSGEIVSADSMQIYKGMHIASAAPDEADKKAVPHSMVEFLPYGENFTVADYTAAARKEIKRILSCGKTPIVVGGTGLYINALADNVSFLPFKTDRSIRDKLSREYDTLGGEEMLKRLFEIDAESAGKLNPSDKRRILRAIEIYMTAGVTKTEQNRLSKTSPPDFDPVMIGITFADRQKLYERINERVDKMIEKGLIAEAKNAYDYGKTCGAVQAIGHKEFFGYLGGEETLGEAIEKLKRSTRRYAKRQLTWFRRDGRISWIYRDITPDVFGEALKILKGKE